MKTGREIEEIIRKQKLKAGLSGTLKTFSLPLSSRQVEGKLRRGSRSLSFGLKQKTLGEAVGIGLFAAQYGKPIHDRMFSTTKTMIMTRIKWASFQKSRAQKLEQNLKDYIDKLVALTPVQGNNAPQNIENLATDTSLTDDRETGLEGLSTDGFVTDCGETGLDGLDLIMEALLRSFIP